VIELYHNDTSSCSQKVRLVLAEKSMEWTSHELNLRAGDQQKPDYLKLNPRGVVPTLVDHGKVIRESNVIMEYLDDEYPEVPLRSKSSLERAWMRLWTKRLDEGHHDLATATLSMCVAFRFQYLERGKAHYDNVIAHVPDPVRRERRRDIIYNGMEAKDFRPAIAMWEELLTDMEAALIERRWLAGDGYSLADIAWTPYLTRLEHLNLLGWLDRRPRLAAWYDRVRARPSYETAMTRWENKASIALMREKGAEAWPRIRAMLAGS
jgi:glutathione S-transferase